MAINLLDVVKGYLTDDLLGKAAGLMGERPEAAKSGFAAAIPGILAGLISKGGDKNGATQLSEMLSGTGFSGSMLNNLGDMFSGGSKTEEQLGMGGKVMEMVFGNKLGKFQDVIGQFTGLKSSSTSSLLKLAAPLLMSVIGKQVRDKGLGLTGLMDLLMGQKEHIQKQAPAGLLQSIGSGLDLDFAKKFATETVSTARSAVNPSTPSMSQATGSGGGFKRLLPFLLLLLGALAVFYLVRSCNRAKSLVTTGQEMIEETAKEATEAVSEAGKTLSQTGESLIGKTAAGFEKLGAFTKRTLSNGKELVVPEKGVEAQLIGFIESPALADKTTWFNLDRILFETGSSRLTQESLEQIQNIADILTAFPSVHLKIGGYTDNTGSEAANMKLSQDRADAVMQAIVARNIQAARLSAEGYGPQHPVATNDTEEGRAQNRRIALRVAQK